MPRRLGQARGTSNRLDPTRGNSQDRRDRKLWLLSEFGNGIQAPCSFCGEILSFDDVTVDRWPVPGCEGGTYEEGNIRPACGPCNSKHGGALRRGRSAVQDVIDGVEDMLVRGGERYALA